jgi:hypothetical protein
LTTYELAFLKKQEAAGKISLHQELIANTLTTTHDISASSSHTFHIPEHNHTSHIGFVYTHLYPETPPNVHQNPPWPTNTVIPQPNLHTPEHLNHHTNSFNLSIDRPKLDFPSFSGDEPVNWLRLCEKYFALAGVPTETWVPLATLHCHGMAQTWWRSLRTPTNFMHWGQFCNMVFYRFSSHSSHSSLEHFHHLKQSSSVTDYIQKFELMALMQMEHPGLTKQYFISSFIAGLKDGIKHYLVPHNPQTLSDTYWEAKELEKGILVKKASLSNSTVYSKPTITFTPTTPQIKSNPQPPAPQPKLPNINPANRSIPIKPRELGKCWSC